MAAQCETPSMVLIFRTWSRYPWTSGFFKAPPVGNPKPQVLFEYLGQVTQCTWVSLDNALLLLPETEKSFLLAEGSLQEVQGYAGPFSSCGADIRSRNSPVLLAEPGTGQCSSYSCCCQHTSVLDFLDLYVNWASDIPPHTRVLCSLIFCLLIL